jgi:hypothetical protein
MVAEPRPGTAKDSEVAAVEAPRDAPRPKIVTPEASAKDKRHG